MSFTMHAAQKSHLLRSETAACSSPLLFKNSDCAAVAPRNLRLPSNSLFGGAHVATKVPTRSYSAQRKEINTSRKYMIN